MRISARGNWVISSPAVADGKVYVGSLDHKVYALNATKGALVWSYTTGSPVESSPAVAGGVVYVGSDDNNVYAFGPRVQRVAVTSVASFKTVVCLGFSTSINVMVADQGIYPETFNVTAYVNATSIGMQEVTGLPSGNSTQLVFTWNTILFAYGNYTLSAYVWPVPGETDTANNTFTDGWVIVSIVGDITGPNGVPDGLVDMYDVGYVASRFLAEPGKPLWDPNAGINGDGIVDMMDIGLAAAHFLQQVP